MALVQQEAKQGAGIEVEVVAMQLMKMLFHGRTTSSWKYRRCCASHGQPAYATGVPSRPDELRV